MVDIISEYIDIKLLLIILVALFSFIVLKVIYRRISFPKIVQIFLTLLVIVGNVFLIYTYVNEEESILIQTTNTYYIKGKVKFVSDAIDKIRLEYTDTNVIIQDLEKKEVLVRVAGSTGIYDKNGKKISLNNIQVGDSLYIKTSNGSLKNGQNEISAKTIQKY